MNSTLQRERRRRGTVGAIAIDSGRREPAPFRPACQQGFSLLELLVTLIVIVLITSLVSLTVSSGGQDVQLEASVRNLADVAEYAIDEAQMTGNDYGLRLDEEFDDSGRQYRYGWRVRHLDGWAPPPRHEEIFAAHLLPPGIDVELELEDSVFSETELDEEDEDEPRRGAREPLPQVVFYASGEATVGAINVRERESGDLLWRIEWDLLGRFKLLPRGEEPLEDDI
ncbi:MAG: prepilin-type N-terminal cleavage/methylation domain-containing protein [Halioglobus sp.]|nr:prepilin-type N-terminal cleavage/methylation domain-containing protein [Halioglobus sp.]